MTTIQGLWIGPELSVMEALSISSFLQHGQAYHLYVYNEVANIPVGTIVKDANAILPESMIFQYAGFNTVAGFANSFRYKLLLDKGGWWVDTDTICLKPFDFEAVYVFSSEWDDQHQGSVVNAGMIKTPVSSPIMAHAWQACEASNPAQLQWGDTGPKLLGEAVGRFGLTPYVKPYQVFCPFGWKEWESVLNAAIFWEFDATTYAVHLWNEMWRRNGYDKNKSYHPDCLYEQLKRRYLAQ